MVERERLCHCCIRTVTGGDRLIPFYSFNTSSNNGKRSYRHQIWSKFEKRKAGSFSGLVSCPRS